MSTLSKPTVREFLWRFVVVVSILAGVTYAMWWRLERPPLGIDDANIFFVYGRNLSDGAGLVYNRGGERVEGYSSVLWMLIVTAVLSLFEQPEVVLLIVSLIMLAVALTYLWRFVDRGPRVSLPGLLLLVWLITSPGFIVWNSLALMDTVLWTSLVTVTTVAILSGVRTRFLGMLIALILLARPEGMLWSVFFVSLQALKIAVQRGFKSVWYQTRALWGTIGIVLLLLTAFRLWYFGYPLPNTYYAKVSPDMAYNLMTGTAYLLGFFMFNQQVLLSVGTLSAGLLLNLRWLLRKVWRPGLAASGEARLQYMLSSLIGLLGLLTPVLTGGDHFALFRFYQPIWPVLFLPIVSLAYVIRNEVATLPNVVQKSGVLVAAAVFLVAPRVHPLYQVQLAKMGSEFTLAAEGQDLGRKLDLIFEEDLPSVGVIAAGGVAFTYNGTIVDLMGLNNVRMAHALGNRYGIKNHAAFNFEVFLDQRPDLLVHGWDTFLERWICEERFVQHYQFVILSDGNQEVQAYVERDYLSGLREEGRLVISELKEVECLER